MLDAGCRALFFAASYWKLLVRRLTTSNEQLTTNNGQS
jgi:hypothetical protein